MRVTAPRHLGGMAAPFLACALAACGGDKAPSPRGPTSPAPAPAPTPTPVPTPTPLTIGVGCGLTPTIADGKEKCERSISDYWGAVNDAIEQVIREKPYIFNFSDTRGDGGFKLLREAEFVLNVHKNLEGRGYCTGLYAEEMAVKKNNDYSENFDLVLATGHIRRGDGMYASTCYPASFSWLPTPVFPQTPGCSLPPSGELWCAREEQTFLQLLDDAIVQTTQEHPEWFDPKDLQPGTDWIKALDGTNYLRRVVEVLRTKGVCAKQDKDEINIKRTNDSSENYDILSGTDYVRRGPGTYVVTCWPAQF